MSKPVCKYTNTHTVQSIFIPSIPGVACPCITCCGSSRFPGSPLQPTNNSMGILYTFGTASDIRGFTMLPNPEFWCIKEEQNKTLIYTSKVSVCLPVPQCYWFTSTHSIRNCSTQDRKGENRNVCYLQAKPSKNDMELKHLKKWVHVHCIDIRIIP